ncbi:MAG TPA: prepilin-type N-terminal cleavage/methylation domain-containing protein [Deltaproteobacteria bacterium]|nr:prepilin-type N-terminal cleavage/methylation domain-containing protein [Deltaproteobacteria bacterium]
MKERLQSWLEGQQMIARRSRRRGRRRGMSLVEVMVVIAIILTLMSILAIGVFSVFGESQIQTTILTMGKVSNRVELYALRKKKPPSTSEGLAAAFGNEQVPVDSWGNEFRYVQPGPNGKAYDIISLGSDGQEGGTGNAADIRWSEQQ